MKFFNIREITARSVFWLQNIRYLSKKHHLAAVILCLLLIMIVFTSIFISQKREIERKENIIRSFYENGKTGGSPDTDKTATVNEDTLISVHICGEVTAPGVYEVKEGSRVLDLLRAAGGETEAASLDHLNLAQEAVDGQKIYVPSREEVISGDYPGADEYGTCEGCIRLINVNTATSGQLESLPGIGPVTAGNIIEYREKYGPLGSKEELMNIRGIGPKKYQQLEALIDV